MYSTLSTFNTTTEVSLSKAPNPQLLPGLCSIKCTHPSAHTQQWTHTPLHRHLCCGTQGAPGFGALLKGTSVVVLKVERVLYIHSPLPTIPVGPRLELATFRLCCDCLPLGHDLPFTLTIHIPAVLLSHCWGCGVRQNEYHRSHAGQQGHGTNQS